MAAARAGRAGAESFPLGLVTEAGRERDDEESSGADIDVARASSLLPSWAWQIYRRMEARWPTAVRCQFTRCPLGSAVVWAP